MNAKPNKPNLGPIVNFLFEVGILAQTPRSFPTFLGSGEQSIAEHTNRTVFIGMVLAMLEPDVDSDKVIKMCLLHDLAEARTGDLNYVNQKYALADEEKAAVELAKTLDFGDKFIELLTEYKDRKTKESILAKDADQIEFVLTLKEQVDIGNKRAETWMPSALKRVSSPVAKSLAELIIKTDSDAWWFGNKDDSWWVDRGGKDHPHQKKRW